VSVVSCAPYATRVTRFRIEAVPVAPPPPTVTA
jgi:hypothetical protein